MFSNPGFDPNDFVGGIQPGLWRALNTDPRKPLLDRTISAIYPPASTWKLATAAAGLEPGMVQAETRMPMGCAGGWFYAGRYARCWNPRGHGSLDLRRDRPLVQRVLLPGRHPAGASAADRGGHAHRLQPRSGIDLPGEMEPIFPTGPEWWRRRFGLEPHAERGDEPLDRAGAELADGAPADALLLGDRWATARAAAAPRGAGGRGRGPGEIRMALDEPGLRALWAGLLTMLPGGTGLHGLARAMGHLRQDGHGAEPARREPRLVRGLRRPARPAAGDRGRGATWSTAPRGATAPLATKAPTST
jgi:penicillin-binding protein 2